MSKSRARLLAELLNASGRVKKDKSDLAGADSIIDLDTLPTITNAKLENSSVTIAGEAVSLGASLSLNTGHITEHTNYKYYTDARVRAAISVDGNLSYNSSTGVLSYTTPTTIASLSNHDTDDLSEGTTNLYFTNARARGAISVSGNALSYNSSTGVISSSYEESPTFTGTVTSDGDINLDGKLSIEHDGSNTGDVLSLFDNRFNATSMYGFGLASGTLYYKANTRHQFYSGANYDNSSYDVQFDGQNFVIRTGNLMMGGNTFVDSSRNITAGTISSGAITSTGASSFGDIAAGGAADSNYDLKVYGLARFQGAANFVAATNPIQVGGTTIIDASRNLTNIGTISSGAITSSGSSVFNPTSDMVIVNEPSTNTDLQTVMRVGTSAGGLFLTTNNAIIGKGAYYDGGWIATSTTGSSIDFTANNRITFNTFSGATVGGAAAFGARAYIDASGLNVSGTVTATSYSGTLASSVTGTTQSASDNSTKVATTAYVDSAVSGIVDSAPGTLNTLNELAAALGDDANFSTTVTNSIATKLPLAGGTITGRVTFPTGSSTKPILAEGFYARTTGDTSGTHDIWGISGQYNPSASSAADQWGIQWSGSPNEINFIGAGQKKLSIDLDTAGLVKIDNNKVWHEGNDGTGSGLDADYLDGIQGSQFLRSDAGDTHTGGTITLGSGSSIDASSNDRYLSFRVIRNAGTANLDGMYIGYGNSGSGHTRLFGGGATSGGLYIRGSGANDLTYGNNTGIIWHSANDGSGSGLDADLLDGVNSASFLRSDASDSGASSAANYLSLGYLHNTKILIGAGTTSFTDAYNDSPWYGIGRTNVGGWHTSSGNTKAQMAFYWGLVLRSGQSRIELGPASNGPIQFGDGGTTVWGKITSTAIYQGTSNLVWHAGNDGSGSGLDADLLDGINSSSFLRSDTSDTMSGELNVSRNGGVTGSSAPQYSDVNIELQTSSNHVPGISFHRGGYSATTLYEYDGELYVNAWTTRNQTGKLVSFGNDGAGSGLDADTVDGIQASSFALRDANHHIDMNNYSITNLNDLSFNDPGPNEGIRWLSGNDWRIYESPDDLATNTGGNLQFVTGSTRRMTIDTSGNTTISGSFLTPNTSGNGLRSANGANFFYPLDAYNNMHIRSTTGSEYHDSTAYYFRKVDQSNLVTITASNTNIAAGTLTRGGNTVWDAGNDGSGSGLDADSVDGYHFTNHEGVGDYEAFLVYGDTDKYYPVVITGGAGHSSDFKIWRGYNEHGPNDWNTSTHKGGLTFRYRISGSAGWGGYPNKIKVLEAEEIYSTILGGIGYTAHTMKHVVWLRGGGTNGARYHMSSTSAFSLAIFTDTSSGYTSGSGWQSYGHSNTSYNTYVNYRTLTERNNSMEGEIYSTMAVNYGDGKVRHVLGGTGPAKTYFTTSNDGSNSGLDADLLDGNQGSHYLNYNNLTNKPTIPTNNNQLTNGAGYQTSTGTVRNLNSYMGDNSSSLQYWQASGQNSNYAPDGSWYNTIRGGHGNPQSYYSNTLAMKMTGGGEGTIYTQANLNGTFQGWNKYWHDNNDGSGSGLDADTLDGLNSTRFSRYGQIYNSSTDWDTIFNTAGQYGQVWHEVHNATSWTNAPGTSAYSYGGLFNLHLASMKFQWYVPHTASSNNGMWYRTNWSSNSWYGWKQMWDSGNDGSGSGLDADTLDGVDSGSFLRSDANDTASGQYTFSKTNDHAIRVGTVRGTVVGSRTGEYIHMYERVHIGSPSGWGSIDAPTYGLSTYGNCELAAHSGRQVTIGGTSSNNAYNSVSSTRLCFGGSNDPNNYHIGTNMENYGGNYTKLDLRWHTGIRMGAQATYGGIRFFDSEDLGTVLFSIGKGDTRTRVETGDFVVANGEINCGAPYLGNMQNGAVNIGRTDTNYAWSGTTWASDIRAGFMANCSETWEFVVHDSGDSVDSFMKYNGTDFEMGNNIGWGTTTFTFASHITAGGNVTAYSDIKLKENIEVIPNALDKVKQIRGVTFTRNDQDDKELRHAGVIAQEVEKVLPEVVGYDKGKDVKTVSYGNMVGLLIEAVKELKQEVDDLKAQLKEK